MDESPVTQPQKVVLLADNEQFSIAALSEGLEKAGYKVRVSSNGEEALASMQVSHPELVLLELVLPKMNGFELLQSMQGSDELRAIPVVVYTNLSQESDKAEAESYGVKDFFTKSDVSLGDVILKVNELLA
jgi:adenylate cyclase